MILNSYYIQFILNSENHFSKNPNGNFHYNKQVICKVKKGQVEFKKQQIQFYNKELLNGWYHNIFAKSKIIFLPIKTNNFQTKLSRKDLKYILYRDYFLKNEKDTNNVYFKDYILNQIIENEDEFELKLSNKNTYKNKVYGIVEITKGCKGYFSQPNYVYKEYSIIELENNIFELFQIQNNQYKDIIIDGQLTIYSNKYDGNFISIDNLEDANVAYKNDSDGAIKKLLTNYIYETYEQALNNKPSNQLYHQQLFDKKITIDSPLNPKIFDFRSYKQRIKTKYKIKQEKLSTLRTNKISNSDILTGFTGGFFKQNIEFSLSGYNTNSSVNNGYWYIKDDQNKYYAAGIISQHNYINMPQKIKAYNDQRTTVSLYYYSVNKVTNTDYSLPQNFYLIFYASLNNTNNVSNTFDNLTYPQGTNLIENNGITVLNPPYITTNVNTLPANKTPITISFLMKLNELNNAVLFSYGCSQNQAFDYISGYSDEYLRDNTTPYMLKKYLNIGINSEGYLFVNKNYCNYTFEDNECQFSELQTESLITANTQLELNKKQILVRDQQTRYSLARYYPNKYNYCNEGQNNGFFISNDGKIKFSAQLQDIQEIQCAYTIQENKENFPFGSIIYVKSNNKWIKTDDCIVSTTTNIDDIFAIATYDINTNYQILNAKVINDWYFIQLKYDGQTLSLYLDNQLIGEKNCNLDITGNEICIGKNIQGNLNTNNYIRQVKIFNMNLSQSESNSQKYLSYDNLIPLSNDSNNVQFNYINNSEKLVKYEIYIKKSVGKIEKYYRWLNYTPLQIIETQKSNHVIKKITFPIEIQQQ